MDNDAKSCYDRVVPSLALLISHHFGVPATTCMTVGITLQTMIFRIRTALGDSEQEYTHSASNPVHGVGQGGTASPALWLLVSSILFDCFQSQAQGMTMLDPTMYIDPTNSSQPIQQWLEAIVDDTSIFTNLADNPNIADLIQALQQDAQLWEHLLSTSGGCLELSKCFYYTLAWVFSTEGVPSPMSPTAIDAISPRIHLKEYGHDTFTPIQSKAPQASHKTLGVWKTMIGDDSDHLKTLETRSNNMAAIVATGSLHPYQAEVAVRMMYTPAMGYSLPPINVSEEKLNKIQFKALESFIPAMSYNRNFPRCIVLGPSEFGGLGVPHLYTEANIHKLELLIMHIRCNSTLGKLFLTMLNWTQVHIGKCTPLLEDYSAIPYVDNWFTGLRQFLYSVHGKLVIPTAYRPILERQHDSSIMESFCSLSPPLSANQLRHLHAWRLYFRVQTLSDITNASGNAILESYLQFPPIDSPQHNRIDRKSKILWPHQPAPHSKVTFSLWVRSLRRCFLQPHGLALRKSLGIWTVSPSKSLSTWTSYIHCQYKSIILIKNHQIIRYASIVHQTATTITFSTTTDSDILSEVPSNYIPVDTVNTLESIVASHYKQKQSPEWAHPPSRPRDIHEAIQSAPLWQKNMLQHFRIHDVERLTSSLTEATGLIFSVSDGGMRDGIGSFGVSVGTSRDTLFLIEGPAPGFDELMTAFRSEAFGLLASLSFLRLFITVHQIHIPANRTIMTYCDNLALVDWINKILDERPYPRMFLRPEADVIMQILEEIRELRKLNIIHKFHHVLGHQDKNTPYDQLSRQAQLNVDADHHATNFLNNCKPTSYTPFSANPVDLYIEGNIITRDYQHRLRISSGSPDLRSYMIQRFDWKQSTPDLIWWQVHGSTIESFAKGDRRRITKFIFGWLPTCERLLLYRLIKIDTCPSCKSCSETHKHLITCQAGTRSNIKDSWLDKLTAFLKQDRYTPPDIENILTKYLTSILYNTAYPTFDSLPTHIQRAHNDQTRIGWFQLLQGRLALQWGNCIATHLSNNKIPDKEMTALVWGRKITKSLFRLSLDLWQKRNMDAHQPVNSTRQHSSDSPWLKQRLLDQITEMQQSQPDIRYYERDFVYKPIEILATFRLSQLKAWYQAACSIVKYSKKRVKHNTARNVSRFKNSMQPMTHDPETSSQTHGSSTSIARDQHSDPIPAAPNISPAF